jgi:hypothetical protein
VAVKIAAGRRLVNPLLLYHILLLFHCLWQPFLGNILWFHHCVGTHSCVAIEPREFPKYDIEILKSIVLLISYFWSQLGVAVAVLSTE